MNGHQYVHFDPQSGLIVQFASRPFAVVGLDVARVVRVPDGANGHTHKVDLARLVDCAGVKACRLIRAAAEENPAPSGVRSFDAIMKNPLGLPGRD